MELKIVSNFDELLKVFMVRGIVFMEEQNVSYRLEKDEHEFSALHILAEIDDEPVGAGRLRFVDGWAKLERIAVRKNFRGHGYGRQIVDYMIQIAKEKGFHRYKMHAQAYLKSYYEKHGFNKKGAGFQEAGIDHYLMVRIDA